MNLFLRNAALVAAPILAVAASFGAGAMGVSAQIPNPPASFYGSIASPTEIPDGTKVEAYVGDIECSDGTGRTGFTGVDDSRVAVYVVNVFGADFREGCGTPGAEVRIKVGDEFATETGAWQSGRPANVNITFGELPTVVLPTNTPRPPTNTPSAEEATATAEREQTPDPTGEPGDDEDGTPTNTPQGGLESATPGTGGSATTDDDDGGFPVWGIVVIGLAVLGAAGGGVGYLISRNNREPGLEDF